MVCGGILVRVVVAWLWCGMKYLVCDMRCGVRCELCSVLFGKLCVLCLSVGRCGGDVRGGVAWW